MIINLYALCETDVEKHLNSDEDPPWKKTKLGCLKNRRKRKIHLKRERTTDENLEII